MEPSAILANLPLKKELLPVPSLRARSKFPMIQAATTHICGEVR